MSCPFTVNEFGWGPLIVLFGVNALVLKNKFCCLPKAAGRTMRHTRRSLMTSPTTATWGT
jgi:hypothetical protein